MKRILSIILVMLLLLCGCREQTQDLRSPGNFYYTVKNNDYNDDFGTILAELKECNEVDSIAGFVSSYLEGPATDSLESPFPMGTRLIDASITDGTAYITLNALFSTLTGYGLTTACACMARSVMEFYGVTGVVFYAENSLLDNQASITITMDMLVFSEPAE